MVSCKGLRCRFVPPPRHRLLRHFSVRCCNRLLKKSECPLWQRRCYLCIPGLSLGFVLKPALNPGIARRLGPPPPMPARLLLDALPRGKLDPAYGHVRAMRLCANEGDGGHCRRLIIKIIDPKTTEKFLYQETARKGALFEQQNSVQNKLACGPPQGDPAGWVFTF